jgi:hypothetical protein
VPEVAWKNGDLRLTFPGQWLHEHPLTQVDLEQETRNLQPSGLTLTVAPAG